MKFGRTLNELAMEITRQQEAKKDYLVNTQFMHMDADKNLTQMSVRNDKTGETFIFGINEIAHNQIGTALKIPASYYDYMRDKNPQLLADNVNSWFQKEPKDRMLRTMVYENSDQRMLRAVVGPTYNPIDNYPVASTILPIIADMKDAIIESCEITEQRMYIKVVNPRLTTEVVPGDIVQSGILISNSEVGMGSLIIQPLVYRLVCSNGMVVNEAGQRRRHVGRRNIADEDFSLYTDETKRLDDMALLAKIRDTVRAVVDETQFNKVVKMMRDAKEAKITTTNIPGMVELTGNDFGFTKAEGESILNYLIRGNDLSLYGMANAVTRAAQDVESYDRSTAMEGIGYNILGMSASKWNRLNAVSTVGAVA